MIYLKREQTEFTKTKAEFRAAYVEVLEDMLRTFEKKGATRDVGSPIHHRQSPLSMLSIAQAKCRRIESILSTLGWAENPALLAQVRTESLDIANYTVFLASLCSMLGKEAKG